MASQESHLIPASKLKAGDVLKSSGKVNSVKKLDGHRLGWLSVDTEVNGRILVISGQKVEVVK